MCVPAKVEDLLASSADQGRGMHDDIVVESADFHASFDVTFHPVPQLCS